MPRRGYGLAELHKPLFDQSSATGRLSLPFRALLAAKFRIQYHCPPLSASRSVFRCHFGFDSLIILPLLLHSTVVMMRGSVDVQLKDIWSRIVPANIADHFGSVDGCHGTISHEDSLPFGRSSDDFSAGIDDAALSPIICDQTPICFWNTVGDVLVFFWKSVVR
jgi:hypothetical protein